MNDERDKWIDNVFQSMKGSPRAKARPELFSIIKNQINVSEAKVVSLRQRRYALTAVVLILILNVFALRQFIHNINLRDSEMYVLTQSNNESIISNYKIYE